MLRHIHPIALGILCWSAAVPVTAAHPHYERLLQRGTYALEREAYPEAVQDLRLACFGLLEEPPKLAVCLTRLAVAQARIDDGEGFLDTFRRVVEVEERFGAYAEAALEPDTRRRFEAVVTARIPSWTLEATPAFAHLVGDGTAEAPPEQAATEAPPPPPNPPAAPEEPPESAPPPPETPDPPSEAPPEAVPKEPGDPPAEAAPEETQAPPPRPAAGAARPELGPEDRETLERAYQLLGQARTREDLEEPYRLTREVADANPAARGAQHLAAVIAYRSARWQEAVRYFRRGGDPGDDDPEALFYLAVSLYEAGEPEAAAAALRRSLPRIERTPFVRSYEAKILGNRGGGTGPGAGS